MSERRKMCALSASQSRAADSTRVSSTVCKSNVERLMTLSTSAVGLLLERLAQLVEQARIFDGDNSLCCEIRQQLDLLVSERTNFLTVDADDPDKFVVPMHWHA